MALKDSFETFDGTGSTARGTNWCYQTFTTTSAYRITGVAMRCWRNGAPGNITYSIREVDSETGKPKGEDLCSGSLADSQITVLPTLSWITWTFSVPAALANTTKYAIVYRAPSGDAGNYFQAFGYDSSGYADGAFGTSTDSGSSWSSPSANRDMMFKTYGDALVNVRSVHLGSDGSFLVATAEDGIYLSTDLGDNWTRKTPDAVEDTDWVKGICSDDGTYIIVVSSANAIYRSANSGTAWAAITPAGGDTFSVNKMATSDDGQYMVIVGQNSTDATESCYISTDYGATWSAKKPVAASIEWTECDISNDGTIIAVSTSTYFYISFDSGDTWKEQGMASTAEVWEGLSISGDGTTGLIANTNNSNEFFLGVNTELYSEATWAESALTSAGRALLDDANAAAQATTLGLGTGDSPEWVGATFSGLTASRLVASDGGKGLESVPGTSVHPEFDGITIKDSGDNIIFYVDDDEMYFTALVVIPIEAGMPIGLALALTYASP
jgi:photosystem II stability/assembly factor-like uncharacterized protein